MAVTSLLPRPWGPGYQADSQPCELPCPCPLGLACHLTPSPGPLLYFRCFYLCLTCMFLTVLEAATCKPIFFLFSAHEKVSTFALFLTSYRRPSALRDALSSALLSALWRTQRAWRGRGLRPRPGGASRSQAPCRGVTRGRAWPRHGGPASLCPCPRYAVRGAGGERVRGLVGGGGLGEED